MPAARVSMVGTTTKVRELGAMPAEKSILGSGRAVTKRVASQFTSATANWLAASSAIRPIGGRAHSDSSAGSPTATASATRPPATMAVIKAIEPRYMSNGDCPALRRSASDAARRTSAAPSSSGRPLSIR